MSSGGGVGGSECLCLGASHSFICLLVVFDNDYGILGFGGVALMLLLLLVCETVEIDEQEQVGAE